MPRRRRELKRQPHPRTRARKPRPNRTRHPPLCRPGAMSAGASMLPGVTTLGEPLTRVLGPKTGKGLETAFDMHTVGDLLRHYPRRYYTRGELTDLSSLREGDHVTVLARVDHVSTHPMPQRGGAVRGEVVITDDRAKLVLTFFFKGRGGQYVLRQLVP